MKLKSVAVAVLCISAVLCACSGTTANTTPGSRAGGGAVAASTSSVPGTLAPRSRATALASSITPQDLLATLLNSDIPSSVLPQGFNAPMASQVPLSDVETKHHAIGKVIITLTGPDTQDEIGVTIYPTAADASARWKEPLHVDPSETVTDNRTPPGFSQPALLLSGTVTNTDASGQTQKAGFTSCFVLNGNLEVLSATVSSASTTSGNEAATLALAKAALAYVAGLAGR